MNLLRSVDDDARYVTIDRWTSPREFESFSANFADEYRSLDERLEGIAMTEERIGAFSG